MASAAALNPWRYSQGSGRGAGEWDWDLRGPSHYTPLRGNSAKQAREPRLANSEREKSELKKTPIPTPASALGDPRPGLGTASSQDKKRKQRGLLGSKENGTPASAILLGCSVSFQRLSPNLAPKPSYFGGGGGGGAGPQQRSGVLHTPGGEPGRSPSPAHLPGPGKPRSF